MGGGGRRQTGSSRQQQQTAAHVAATWNPVQPFTPPCLPCIRALLQTLLRRETPQDYKMAVVWVEGGRRHPQRLGQPYLARAGAVHTPPNPGLLVQPSLDVCWRAWESGARPPSQGRACAMRGAVGLEGRGRGTGSSSRQQLAAAPYLTSTWNPVQPVTPPCQPCS